MPSPRPRLPLLVVAFLLAAGCSGSSESVTPPQDDPGVGATSLNDTIAIAVSPANVGPAIPNNFIGLSLETYDLLDPGLRRASFVNMLKTIGVGVLRVGGGSVNTSSW